MSDTYTKEQIENAVYECERFTQKHDDHYVAPYIEIILSALSTAEQERDELKGVQIQIRDTLPNRSWTAFTNYCKAIDRAEKAELERDALAARCAELEARLQGAATSESAMETARQAVDTMGRKMLALDKEIDTSYGPMQPPEIQKDKAIPYLATLIEDYGRRVPRAMLESLYLRAMRRYAQEGLEGAKQLRDSDIKEIAATYGVEVE